MAISAYLLAPLKPPPAVEAELDDPQSNSGRFEPALEEAASTEERLGLLSIASCTAWLTGIEFAVIHGLGTSTFPYNRYADRLRFERRKKVLSEMRSVPEHRLNSITAETFAREVIWPFVLRVYVPRSWYPLAARAVQDQPGGWRVRLERAGNDRAPGELRASWPPRAVWQPPVVLGEPRIESMLALLQAGRVGVRALFNDLADSRSLVAAAGRYLEVAWETSKRKQRGGREWSAPVLFGGGKSGMVLRLVAVPRAAASDSAVCQDSADRAIQGVERLLERGHEGVPTPEDWCLVAADFPGGAVQAGADGPATTVEQVSEAGHPEHVRGPSGSLSLAVALLGSAAGLEVKPNTYASGVIADGRDGLERLSGEEGEEQLMASKGEALKHYSPDLHPVLIVGDAHDREEVAKSVDGKVAVVVADTLVFAAARMLNWSPLPESTASPPIEVSQLIGSGTRMSVQPVLRSSAKKTAEAWASALQGELPVISLSLSALLPSNPVAQHTTVPEIMVSAFNQRHPRNGSAARDTLLRSCVESGNAVALIFVNGPIGDPGPFEAALDRVAALPTCPVVVFTEDFAMQAILQQRGFVDCGVSSLEADTRGREASA